MLKRMLLVVLSATLFAGMAHAGTDQFGFVDDSGICPWAIVDGVFVPPCASSYEVMSLGREAGAEWIRLWVYGNNVNPAPGVFNWEQTDQEVRRIYASGFKKVYITIQWWPKWMSAGEPAFEPWACAGKPAYCVNPDFDSGAHYVLAQEIMLRYGGKDAVQDFGGRAENFGCGNEPENNLFWPRNDLRDWFENVVMPCREAMDAVKEQTGLHLELVGPDTLEPRAFKTVIGFEPEFAKQLGREFVFDKVAFHSYGGGKASSQAANRLMQIDNTWASTKSQVRGRPLWLTETGVSSDYRDPISMNRQAATLRGLAEGFLKRPWVQVVFFYKLQSSGHPKDFSVMKPDGTPKPAYYALKEVFLGSGSAGEDPERARRTDVHPRPMVR